MTVLFVCSGNSNTFNGISNIVFSQGESLRKNGVNIVYFPLEGSGFFHYLSNIRKLNTYLKKNKIDLLHAHYGISGVVALLSSRNRTPVVISFMGDDLLGAKNKNGKQTIKGKGIKYLSKLTARYYNYIIVKSSNLSKELISKRVSVIPNGVNLEFFKPTNLFETKTSNRIKLLFLSDPNRPEKNFRLLEETVKLIDEFDLEIDVRYNISKEKVLESYWESDIICLSSFHEGSPNVIKEAMALNKVTLTTNVGDVYENFHECNNLFISEAIDTYSYRASLLNAIHFLQEAIQPNSREILIKKQLDSESIAKRIIEIYKNTCAE